MSVGKDDSCEKTSKLLNKLSTESESGRLTLVEPDADVESDDDEEALVMREERERERRFRWRVMWRKVVTPRVVITERQKVTE